MFSRTSKLVSSTVSLPLRRLYSTPAFNRKEHTQFIVIGKDGTDAKALERRMAARPAHMTNAKKAKKEGILLYGGALLDDKGKMVGSVMLFNNITEADLKKWLEIDPYVSQKAWESYEIKPYKLADLD